MSMNPHGEEPNDRPNIAGIITFLIFTGFGLWALFTPRGG